MAHLGRWNKRWVMPVRGSQRRPREVGHPEGMRPISQLQSTTPLQQIFQAKVKHPRKRKLRRTATKSENPAVLTISVTEARRVSRSKSGMVLPTPWRKTRGYKLVVDGPARTPGPVLDCTPSILQMTSTSIIQTLVKLTQNALQMLLSPWLVSLASSRTPTREILLQHCRHARTWNLPPQMQQKGIRMK